MTQSQESATATEAHQPMPIEENDDEISLLDLLQVVVDNLRLLVLGPLAAGLLALGITFAIPPTFTTSTKFMPPQQSSSGEAALLKSLGALGGRSTLMTDRVGTGLVRALYSTYLSYLPPELFAYAVPQHSDPRGTFVEMLKTPDCGQFSYFTAHPGITRGGHYHHSKTEKFLVIKGQARFKFRHMQTGETHELLTSGDKAEVVETVPGWTHDITNIGADEMVVMLWANEVFDRARPDTFACAV